jgi:alpha-tubulin suppressor-like RCC1 family protein
MIVGGWEHTCALVDGGVKCWGSNAYGQLGDGTNVDRLTPVDVIDLDTGVAKIAAGWYHTCALTIGGSIKCWGYSGDGELGIGSTTGSTVPVTVTGFDSGARDIGAGGYHTCAITDAGAAKCWGRNNYGQIGDNSTTNRISPVQVVGLSADVSVIEGGTMHTCAVMNDSSVKCWGVDAVGLLVAPGNSCTPTAMHYCTAPEVVSGLNNVAALTAGDHFTCALTMTGGIKCWGGGQHGVFGTGTPYPTGQLTDVIGLTSGVTAIAGGQMHMCAQVGGGIKCWGYNEQGQIGDNTNDDRYTPVNAFGLTAGVGAIGAGAQHACTAVGTQINCWGSNSSGQLGIGAPRFRSTPADVVGLGSQSMFLSAAWAHTCAVTGTGGVRCWGNNYRGQLGDGMTTHRNTPVDVTGIVSGTTQVASGDRHSCALVNSGVKCWGANERGQLGNGTNTNSLAPVDVMGLLDGVGAISAGTEFSCALMKAGTVKCWGANYYGNLGNGTFNASNIPVDVSDLTEVNTISSYGSHVCVLTNNGAMKCWGWNQDGEIGDGTTQDKSAPVTVNGLGSSVTSVSAGGYHTCAVNSLGMAFCWGNIGPSGNPKTPTQVPGISGNLQISASGNLYTCAVDRDTGGVKCWGLNTHGQLGDGTTQSRVNPTQVSGLASNVVSIVTGCEHTCALMNDGTVKCWGDEFYGQLGDTHQGVSSVPMRVLLGPSPFTNFLPFIRR